MQVQVLYVRVNRVMRNWKIHGQICVIVGYRYTVHTVYIPEKEEHRYDRYTGAHLLSSWEVYTTGSTSGYLKIAVQVQVLYRYMYWVLSTV